MKKTINKCRNFNKLAKRTYTKRQGGNELATTGNRGGLFRDFRDLDIHDPFEEFHNFPFSIPKRNFNFGQLDFKENKENYQVSADLPGMRKEDISVSIEEGSLIISGERKEEKEEKGEKVYRKERRYGKFQRVVDLPQNMDSKGIKAEFKDGVLTLTIPKLHKEEQEKKVEIKIE